MITALMMELLDLCSASMLRKEIALGIAAYHTIQHLLAYSAHQANLQPREVNFKYCDSHARRLGRQLAKAAPNTNEPRVKNFVHLGPYWMLNPIKATPAELPLLPRIKIHLALKLAY
jgi:hypothetical protein